MEEATGSTIVALADAGKVRLEWRPTIFLDTNLQAQNTAAGNPKSSATATMAFGCAADAGKAAQFHTAIFQAQPTNEGAGFATDTLVTLATVSGVSDIDTFTQCLSSKKYEAWVNNSYAAFSREGVSSTPTAFLNGTELTNDVIRDVAKLTAAIEAAGATK
jgi:protein-disulfide isomerase